MTMASIIDWLGRLKCGSQSPELQSEQVIRVEDVLRATVVLNTKECRLLKLHDIEGRSLEHLEAMTGMSPASLRQQLQETRNRFLRMLKCGTRVDVDPDNGELH